MGSGNGNGGGGLGLVAVAALAFVCTRMPVSTTGGGLGGTKYHILRYFGLKPKIPQSLVDAEIDKAADRHGIERSLFRALVKVESGKNPDAVSRVGARGLAQIMPFNSRRCGLSDADRLFDPLLNLGCGAKILKEEIDRRRGNITHALQAYNGGPGCIGRCGESIAYSAKVMAIAGKKYS